MTAQRILEIIVPTLLATFYINLVFENILVCNI